MTKLSTKSQDHAKDSGAIDFISSAKFFVPLSIAGIVLSIGLFLTKNLRYGVDFAGGTEMQVRFQSPLDTGRVRSFLGGLGFAGAAVQSFQGGNEFLIRLDPVEAASEREANQALTNTIQKITEGLKSSFQAETPTVERVDTVGPQVGSELKRNGILAAFYSILLILIYVGLRFDYKYAPGAVFCLFHDAILILGLYSLFQWEMNVQIMAAVLTIIGYSMNDTIVVFDRIRENEKLFRDKTFRWVCNRSMNDVLSRTILTSFTTFLSVMVMWALAGGVIRDFALTMAIGIVIGTFSSIYVATPLVILVDNIEKHRKTAK